MHINFLTGKMTEKKKKKSSPEAEVGRAIEHYLKLLGGYTRTIVSQGNNTSGRWRPSAQGTGISDRLCWLPEGKFIAVELKAPGNKRTVTDEQYLYLKAIITRGHRGCVADSVDDLKKALGQSTQELLETLEALRPKTKFCPQSSEPLFP